MLAAPALAESFYKWVDDKGVTHYGEAPPEEEAPVDAIDVTRDRAQKAAPPQAPKDLVVLYSAQDCKECDAARAYLKGHGIRFAEYDVYDSARGKEDYRRLRAKRVPIILVGNQRLDEFTPAAFEALQKQQ
jgi:glutaredoxin